LKNRGIDQAKVVAEPLIQKPTKAKHKVRRI